MRDKWRVAGGLEKTIKCLNRGGQTTRFWANPPPLSQPGKKWMYHIGFRAAGDDGHRILRASRKAGQMPPSYWGNTESGASWRTLMTTDHLTPEQKAEISVSGN